MAALDFPSSPTNGQQYSAPNGTLYTYDGAVWQVVTTAANPWVVQGATITPTDPSKSVSIPLTGNPVGDAVAFGSLSSKGRVASNLAADPNAGVWLTLNRSYAFVVDDATLASWRLCMRGGPTVDDFRLLRTPPSSNVEATVFTVDNAGNLTIPGYLTAQAQPYARVAKSAAQSIPTGVAGATPLTGYDSITANQGGMWNAGAPDRLTVQVAGFYLFGATGYFSSVTGGGRRSCSVDNGAGAIATIEMGFSTGTFPFFSVVHAATCAVGNAIRASAMQDSGAALAFNGAILWAVRVA